MIEIRAALCYNKVKLIKLQTENEVYAVGASYKKLWHLLIDKGMKKRELCELASVSTSSLAKLGKGENVNTDILIKICRALDCGIDDIMEIVPDNETADASGAARKQ